MEYATIIVEKDNGIGSIVLNRPKQMNAISMLMAKEIMQACDELEADQSVSCVIMSGAGKAFCAGGDIKEAGVLASQPTEPMWDGVALWNKMGNRVKSLELPTIAALHGYVLGGGFLLAACCDIRIAAEDAEMAVLLTKPRTFQGKQVVASAADMGLTWILPRLVGAGRAAELMFTGDSITAEKAERIGLVNYVVPAERLMDKARELATKFAEGPRLRLRATKRAIHLSIYDRLAAHMEFEAAVQSHMIRAGKE
jgi:2-(1,2-epoxy-1,2-dihydrophenyl)acetyl-CoA isomerase